MARLPLVQNDNAPPEVSAAFDAATRMNGRVANSMRTFAHSPAILKFLLPLQPVLQKDGLGCQLDANAGARDDQGIGPERVRIILLGKYAVVFQFQSPAVSKALSNFSSSGRESAWMVCL